MSSPPAGRRALAALLALLMGAAPAIGRAGDPAGPKPDDKSEGKDPDGKSDAADRKAEARAHFDKAKALSTEGAWPAALAEFLVSRELYPTWGNTLGVASSLRKLGRFDESLDMFEILLRDFAAAVPADVRSAAQKEVVELRGLVGTIDIQGAEIGAAISVDGRSRGEYPAPSPLRVAAGTHIVRVSKEGFEPFEGRVEVAGNQTARVTAAMRPLAASGKLRVVEKSGAALDVIVDGNRAGATPWEGALSPGNHVLFLRGDGELGTPPVVVTVKKDETASLTLVAEALAATVVVEPEPITASVAIDAVTVGQGAWEGRLRAGKHKLEVAAPGFVTAARDVTIGAGQREVVKVPLARDPSSPFWRKAPPPARFLIEAAGAVPVLPTFGGDIAGGCAGGCTADPGIGAFAALRGGYELPSGLSFGIEAGYLFAEQLVTGRAAALSPVGLNGEAKGTLDDTISIRRSVLAAAWIGFSLGERFPLRARAAVGPLFAWIGDTRSGTMTPVLEGSPYPVGPLSVTAFTTMLAVTPDIRVGYRITPKFEVSVGIDALVLIALEDPAWDPARPINAGADGIGTFPEERFVGRVLVGVAPGLGLRYDFF